MAANDAPWTKATFEPIRDAVAMLAADAATQTVFVDRGPIVMPIVELYENLNDIVPMWLPRMVSDGVISPDLSSQLENLEKYLRDQLESPAWRDDLSALQQPAWTGIRDQAAAVLRAIDAELG